MASVFVGAGAMITDKIRERREAKKAAKREYDENFDDLMAANAARVRHLSGSTDKPPMYDDIMAGAKDPKDSSPVGNQINGLQKKESPQAAPFQQTTPPSGRSSTSTGSSVSSSGSIQAGPADGVDCRDMAA
ncbi:MAG: hypothetical protein M1820_003539 [Bogoriella megaspora]|nr:MAG: hypothetical protein M1820_003539 [Bogoriella megaspora]